MVPGWLEDDSGMNLRWFHAKVPGCVVLLHDDSEMVAEKNLRWFHVTVPGWFHEYCVVWFSGMNFKWFHVTFPEWFHE